LGDLLTRCVRWVPDSLKKERFWGQTGQTSSQNVQLLPNSDLRKKLHVCLVYEVAESISNSAFYQSTLFLVVACQYNILRMQRHLA